MLHTYTEQDVERLGHAIAAFVKRPATKPSYGSITPEQYSDNIQKALESKIIIPFWYTTDIPEPNVYAIRAYVDLQTASIIREISYRFGSVVSLLTLTPVETNLLDYFSQSNAYIELLKDIPPNKRIER